MLLYVLVCVLFVGNFMYFKVFGLNDGASSARVRAFSFLDSFEVVVILSCDWCMLVFKFFVR